MFALAAEMLNVVMMFGVVSRVSHVILGLTVLAWSNSIGDLVADLAVAKQGFPRMAISVKTTLILSITFFTRLGGNWRTASQLIARFWTRLSGCHSARQNNKCK